jgi:hypothetical protein
MLHNLKDLHSINQDFSVIEDDYEKLAIIVGFEAQDLITHLASDTSTINVGKWLSRLLLQIPMASLHSESKNILKSEILHKIDKKVLLVNCGILFDPVLKLDPIPFLKGISRQVAIVMQWPGCYQGSQIEYGDTLNTEEYRTYPTEGLHVFVREKK